MHSKVTRVNSKVLSTGNLLIAHPTSSHENVNYMKGWVFNELDLGNNFTMCMHIISSHCRLEIYTVLSVNYF